MKKIFTLSFLFAACFTFFISCTKDVKAPSKVANNTAYTMPSAGTQTQNQAGHTCGGHTSTGGGGY